MQRAKAFLFDLQAFQRGFEPNRGVDPFNLNIPEPGVNQPLRQHFGVAQAERAGSCACLLADQSRFRARRSVSIGRFRNGWQTPAYFHLP